MQDRPPDSDRPVGILTAAARRRRDSGAGNLWLLTVPALALLAGTAGAAADAPTEAAVQPLEDIAQAAKTHLRERLPDSGGSLSFEAGQLDSRLRLPRCGKPLETFLAQGERVRARTVVGVRCTGMRPWKVYVPVDVAETRPVLVARRALPRGHVLTADDLAIEERDVSGLIGGYLGDSGAAVGRRLGRRLVSGSHLTPGMLKSDPLVRRGQSVTLLVRSGSVNIRMTGKALMDGAANQRIRVTNDSSRRVVEGLVRSPEFVEVLTQ